MNASLLVVGHAADRTGPPVYLLNLLRWLRAEGVAVEVDVVLLAGGPLLDELRSLASVTVFPPLPGEPPEEVRRGIVEGRIDEDGWWAQRRDEALRELMAPHGHHRVVYATCAPAAELLRALPPGERVVLSHVHELEVGLVRRLSEADRGAFLTATRLFSVAEAVTDHLVHVHGVDRDAIEPHPEMVDVAGIVATTRDLDVAAARAERGIPVDHHVVAACGTIEPRKGTDLFLRLAWHLRRDHRPMHTTLVWIGGDEAGVARARQRAIDLGVEGVVQFVGPQADAPVWFRMADVFVMPSREDPFPLVCIEAAAAGTPIVAFDTGGIPELLRLGCGEVAAYPDVGDLSARVRGLLDDPDRCTAMGEKGREVVLARHDATVVAPRSWAAIERWM